MPFETAACGTFLPSASSGRGRDTGIVAAFLRSDLGLSGVEGQRERLACPEPVEGKDAAFKIVSVEI